MITALNALIECMVTGLFTAVFLALISKVGFLPLMFITYTDPRDEAQEEPYDE